MCQECTNNIARQLGDFSEDELFVADQFVNGNIFEILKVDAEAVVKSIEVSVGDAIVRDFNKLSEFSIRLINKFMLENFGQGQKVTKTKIKKMLQPMEKLFGESFTKSHKKKVLQAAIGMYNLGKKEQQKLFAVKPSFNVIDDISKVGIGNNSLFWIGNYYNSVLSNRVSAIVSDILIDQGLPLDEAAKKVAAAVGVQLGVQPTDQMPRLSKNVRLPMNFKGTPESYFRLVVTTARVTAKSFGTISFMQDLGAEWYALTNPMDNATTPLCAFLNGKVFSVSSGAKVMDQYLEANTPDQAKNALPFNSLNSLLEQFGMQNIQQWNASGNTPDALASKANVALPPFHGFCRTIAEPTGITGPSPRPIVRQAPPTRFTRGKISIPKPISKPKAPKRARRKSEPLEQEEITTDFNPKKRGYLKNWKAFTNIEKAENFIKETMMKTVFYQGRKARNYNESQKLRALNTVAYEIKRFKEKFGLFINSGNRIDLFSFANGNANWRGTFFGREGLMSRARMRLDSKIGRYKTLKESTNKKLKNSRAEMESRLSIIKRRKDPSFSVSERARHAAATFRHETGHAVQFIANRITNGDINSKWYEKYLSLGAQPGSKKTIQPWISEYAGNKNAFEFFAEIFTIYTSPEFVIGSIDKVLGAGTESLIEETLVTARQSSEAVARAPRNSQLNAEGPFGGIL